MPRPAARLRRQKPDSYHHGDLRRALIDATCLLIEEGGLEAVTVRAAAKRAGVSPGAPFRHFASRSALLTAVAEEATRRLHAAVFAAIARPPADDPLARLRAMGIAYFRWVMANPTYFAIVSTRSLIDWDASATLERDNEAIRAEMDRLLTAARAAGLLRFDDVARMQLAARALVYGLGRMYVDGHFAQWLPRARSREAAMRAVLDLFLAGLRRTPPAGVKRRRVR